MGFTAISFKHIFYTENMRKRKRKTTEIHWVKAALVGLHFVNLEVGGE